MSVVYHGLIPEDDVTVPVISESVFISPYGRVTVNLFTCLFVNVDRTSGVDVAIKYEATGNISLLLLCIVDLYAVTSFR